MKLARRASAGDPLRAVRSTVLAIAVLALAAPAARADHHHRSKHDGPHRSSRSCLKTLDRMGVKYSRIKRRRIKIGVRVRGPLGGVTYKSWDKRPLILDCSLAVSLAGAGPLLAAHGIDTAIFSGAYSVRNVAGTHNLSKHSFGLAIDVHVFEGERSGKLVIKDDFEQGLGDDIDCVGQPLTDKGTALKTINCQLRRSELFHYILDPDYDAHHYNHFHLEAAPWRDRSDASLERVAKPKG